MNRPWMPLYPADYLKDTGHLSTLEHGAYLLLILHYWSRGGLPAIDVQLQRICRVDADEWACIRPTLADLFDTSGETWRHKRIEEELERAAEISGKRRESASKRYAKASAKDPAIADANAEQLHTQSQSQSQSQENHNQQQRPELAAPAAAADLDVKEIKRQCVQATGWEGAEGISAVIDLVREGVDLEERILPVLRTLAADRKKKGEPTPNSFVYALKAIRDPSRRAAPSAVVVEQIWVPVGSPKWAELIARGKKEGFLRGLVRLGDDGSEGIPAPQQWFAERIAA